MPIVEPAHYQHFTVRMMEICSSRAPWHRRLWRAGTLQIASELRDDSVRPGTPESAITEQRKHARHCLNTDNGIADRGQAVSQILGAIKPGITTSDHSWIGLDQHLRQYDHDYLLTWAAALDAPPSVTNPIDVDGAVRRITAHILDTGMHKRSLYAWLRTIRDDPNENPTIGDFLREADRRLKAPLRRYTFCVPIQSTPPFDLAIAAGWMTAKQTSDWKKLYASKAPGISQRGSFIVEVHAHDINTAQDLARTQVANLTARLHLGARNPIVVSRSMWSKEKGSEMPTQATNRLINVHSMQRLGRLHELTMADYITNTLTLIQPLRTGSPHLAIVNGWAAIESLMVGPADQNDIIAAERFALIVAASMLRAEFTKLSRSYASTHSGPDAKAMQECTENIDRSKLFQRHLQTNPTVTLDPLNALALSRIRPALTNPKAEVQKIADIVRREMTRLYRKRNAIVHGGQVHEGSLHSLSETLAPLIGAGVDRIVHVGTKFGVPPIELSAVAESRLHYLPPSTPAHAGGLLDMLEF